jgi:hypothetical protein
MQEDRMAQPREQAPSHTGKPARASKRVLVHAAPTGRDVTDVAEVLVTKARFARIAGKLRPLGRVVAGYADTFAEAQRTGRPVTIMFEVSPDGDAEPVAAPAKADVLATALAAARLRGQAKVADILKGEDMLTARDFGRLIGASHETVNAKRKRFEVLGLEGATRGVKYPRWQLTEAGLPLPGLAELFSILGEQPWAVYRFLRATHAELGGRTALEALKGGAVEAVRSAAHNQAHGVFA